MHPIRSAFGARNHRQYNHSLNDKIIGRRTLQKNTLKVFLMAGQSNMVGMASLDHMSLLVKNHTAIRYALWDESTSSYKVRKDVYMKFLDNDIGPLTLGPKSGFAATNRFGAEVMFGWTIGDYIAKENNSTNSRRNKVNVVLLKFAYDGQSLAVDFRPPSSGLGNYDRKTQTDYGRQYRKMIPYFQNTIKKLPQLINNPSMPVEIAGFVWFHGWKDMKDEGMVKEYAKNLANLIADVRKDLNVTKLPFVVGELGQHGLNVTGKDADRVLGIRLAQERVCKEQPKTTKFVRTAPHVGSKTDYDMIHHYYGRADTYCYIGRALGIGMISLFSTSSSSSSDVVDSTWSASTTEPSNIHSSEVQTQPVIDNKVATSQPTSQPKTADHAKIATIARSLLKQFSKLKLKFMLRIRNLR